VAEEENVCQEMTRGTKCTSWTEYKPGKNKGHGKMVRPALYNFKREGLLYSYMTLNEILRYMGMAGMARMSIFALYSYMDGLLLVRKCKISI